MTKIDYFKKFEQWALHKSRAEIGGLMKEYIAESNQLEWDGFEARDRRGISKLLCDLMAYHEHNENDFATKISNTNPVS